MKSSLWVVNMGFVPRSADVALLFLRVAVGVSMIVLHGWEKFIHFPEKVQTFPNIFGGSGFSLGLAVFAELFCSALLVAGIVTRFAAAVLIATMSVALFKVHGGDMTAAGGGEGAALYLFAYITIFIAGAGRFSADGAGGPFTLASFGALAGVLVGYPVSYYFQAAEYKETSSVGDYVMHLRTVLRDDALQGKAIGVTLAAVVLLAVLGFLIGRAMNQRTVRVAAATPPPVPPE